MFSITNSKRISRTAIRLPFIRQIIPHTSSPRLALHHYVLRYLFPTPCSIIIRPDTSYAVECVSVFRSDCDVQFNGQLLDPYNDAVAGCTFRSLSPLHSARFMQALPWNLVPARLLKAWFA